MGKTRTPKYRLEVMDSLNPRQWVPLVWRGRADSAQLAKWVRTFEASTAPGGVNAHLGHVVVWHARIIHQATRERVALYDNLNSFVAV